MNKLYIIILSFIVSLSLGINNNKSSGHENKIMDYLRYNDESINYNSTEDYDISVVAKLNYNDDYSRNFLMNDASQLHLYRTNAKNYYLKQSTNILNQFDLSDYNYEISYFSPYVEIIFDDLQDYEDRKEKLINNLNCSTNVENIMINCIEYDEAVINSSSLSTNYPLSDAFEDIGTSTLTYTGDGVRVGTIESGTPNSTVNLRADKFTRLSNTTTAHSTLVTSIIGGTSGIAEDVNLYCIGLSDYSFTSCVNKLINDYDVNIINMSNGTNQNGMYDNYCAYIDYIIATTGCTFVKSAGNNGDTTSRYISSPGCGMNVITVGSISANQNVSYFSSWNTSNDYLLKPDIVAPGEKISNVPNISGSNSGTSFSTPMVSGIIALLMEEFPSLKINPSLVKSVLHNGCVQLPSQYSYFDEHCGFGLVNYQNSRNYLNNSQYNSFNILTNSSNGDIVSSYNVTIPISTKIEINANWTINSTEVSVGNVAFTPNYTQCYLRLYDIQSKTYVKTSSTNSNIAFMSFINGSSKAKQYRIDIVVNGNKAPSGIEIGSFVYNMSPHNHQYDHLFSTFNMISHNAYCECGDYIIEEHNFVNGICQECGYSQHTHVYDDWQYYNRTTHIEVCECGEKGTSTRPHVVSASDVGNYRQCLECHHLLGPRDLALVMYSTKPLQTSINGSYILPNGIIVLVDDDVEAYYNDTLIFYNKNELPQLS